MLADAKAGPGLTGMPLRVQEHVCGIKIKHFYARTACDCPISGQNPECPMEHAYTACIQSGFQH